MSRIASEVPSTIKYNRLKRCKHISVVTVLFFLFFFLSGPIFSKATREKKRKRRKINQ